MRFLLALSFAALALATLQQSRARSAPEMEQRGDYAAALRADPRLSAAWIDAGLAAERERRMDAARRDLLEAARIDHRYLPAWTLAGFFYRHNDSSEFWPWARRAAELSYDDLRPLLELAQAIEPDPVRALRQLGASDRGAGDWGLNDRLVRADLDLLAGARQWSAAQQAARLLLARHDPADKPRLLETAERHIGAGNAAYAWELWRAFYPARLLSNGDLAQQPSGLGFDWRLPPTQGIAPRWTPGLLQFDFDGSQCETCALLEQVLPPGFHALRYRLTYQARVHGLASPSNLHWDLGNHESAALSAAADRPDQWQDQRQDQWQDQSATFPAPHTGLARLRLVYRREPGTVRAEGRLELRRLDLETLP